MAELELVVNGVRYRGWESISVTRSIESLVGQFTLGLSDPWGDGNPWPIVEGDACRVKLDGQIVIDGYVDKRSPSGSKDHHAISYSGRDRAEDLVDCSMLIEDASTKGHKWSYRNINIAQFAAAIAAPHGVSVSVQTGLILKRDPLLEAHPGETGYEAIKRAAASAGVLVVSDGAGGIIITRAGTDRATPLVEGVNILDGSSDYDASDRFARYLVSSQPPGTDEAYGEATRVLGEATDGDVRRQNRVLLIRPDKGCNAAEARRRANWEARVRAAKSLASTATVQGWRQPNGELWTINEITRVQSPRLLMISDEDMLISQVTYTVDNEGGTRTAVKLVRPDAFLPEPQLAAAAAAGGVGWTEL